MRKFRKLPTLALNGALTSIVPVFFVFLFGFFRWCETLKQCFSYNESFSEVFSENLKHFFSVSMIPPGNFIDLKLPISFAVNVLDERCKNFETYVLVIQKVQKCQAQATQPCVKSCIY